MLTLVAILSGAPAAVAAAPAPLIWAFGDSLTAGYGLAPDQGFTARLQAALRDAGVPATVRNGGVAGDTAAQGRARLRWGLRGLGGAPDLVLVELGANDMLRGLPTAQTKANLDMILAELHARRIPVLLIGMRAAPNLGRDYVRAFDAMYPALAKTHGVPLYPFFLDGVAGHPRLIQADGLHPDAGGVDVIVRRLLPTLVRLTKRH
ncbi:arylesterase [Sphingomonas sp. CROZ-RG-20F-R02-07]|uniref:arylesterase n=1 Tax=Sphingomonas sp. CROZ-RG-20F-R02-07 TaxID=2914832 RepID=UPI001F58DD8F|nr:arylesterase [Sphingomonas sp. CROZ-RG-20F-R02-07]